jgi:magnesium transporter
MLRAMDTIAQRHTPPGTAPGTLSGREPGGEEALHFTLIEYNTEKCEVFFEVPVDECRFRLGTPDLTWIDVSGRPSADMLKTLGEEFSLHPLALEDVFHGNQRSKLDIFDRQVFLVMNDPAWIDGRLKQRQVSIFFGDNYAISFHEHKDDIFAPVRERIQQPDSRLRARGIDYLVYALVDLVIDRKFPLLQQFGDAVETLEDEALEEATPQTLRQIHMLRRSLYGLHRVQWAERETVHAMMRTEVPLIGAETRTYMRDCRDHSIAVLELVENYREMCSSLMELYMMSTSNRLNEVMKVLAIITTIFMPLSFIAALYGMNFDTEAGPWNMPELNWAFGYPAVLGFMAAVVAGMIYWFRRRGWF